MMTSHSPRMMMEMSKTVIVCTFNFSGINHKHETAVLFAEGFAEQFLVFVWFQARTCPRLFRTLKEVCVEVQVNVLQRGMT